jgi:hypothetical protein
MKIKQRSYGGKIFRPKPIIHEEENFLVFASCWGVGDNTQRMVDEIVKYVTAATSDVEVTSPFEYITCLSRQANILRIATLLANDFVYRGENRGEYTSGYEVVTLLKEGTQLTWAHAGGPNLLIKKGKRPLLPLVTQYDLSTDMSGAKEMMPPLPTNLLGIDTSCQIICGDMLIGDNDQVVLASASTLPSAFWGKSKSASLNLEKITEMMTADDPDSPFWIATINF